MKKTFFVISLILCVVLISCATACNKEKEDYVVVECIDDYSITTYKSGEQIELYLNATTNKQLMDHIDSNVSLVAIADKSIVDIQNGYLIPKLQGITYISCKYGDLIKNYNVVVHDGAEYVTSCSVSGSTSNTFSAHVGQTYQISTVNTSSCCVSELKIDTCTSYASVEADELITVNSNGEVRIVGIGNCEIWVHSATNAADRGVRIAFSSSFAEDKLSAAVTSWMTANIEQAENGVITKSELAEIETLTFTELLEFNESEWFTILPSLKSVTFDLSKGSGYNSTYTISSGELSYNFIGNENSEYNFSIISAEREQLNLSFTNFKLSSQIATGIDLSAVKKADISYEGVCNIKGADAQNNGNGCNGITANNLTMTLPQDAIVSIIGGNGTSQSTSGTRVGGIGVHVVGKFDVNAISSSYTTALKIYGGNGGDGYDFGNHGGAGNAGISSDKLAISGNFSCCVYGGNGGNGVAGNSYSKSSKASDGDRVSAGQKGNSGKNGNNGQNGGNGGNGASAIYTVSIEKSSGVKFTLFGGNGGDGADGGRAQNGGNGSKGGDTSGNDNDDDAGKGGKGGNGGNGGKGGNAGNGALAIDITNRNDLIDLLDTTMVHGYGGNAGNGGDGANGGNGGNGGDDKHGGFLGFIGDGPIHGSGGDPGTKGVGGRAGDSAIPVKPFELSNIVETVAKKSDASQATNGKDGEPGSKGSDGDHGAVG